MKTKNILQIIAFLAAFAFMTGCTKDSQLRGDDNAYAKSVKMPSEFPVYNNVGYIKGSLSPVPSAVSMKIFNEKGFSVGNNPATDGTFFVQNLPPDVYSMQIAYLVNQAGTSYWAYYQIDRILVRANEVTELGVITLPWNF
jgi:hypothetical protein